MLTRHDRLARAFHEVMGEGRTVAEIAALIAIMDAPEPPHYEEGKRVFAALMENAIWRRANDGWWVAIKGPNPDDIVVRRTLWEVLEVARDDWRIVYPFVTEVSSHWPAPVPSPR